jgi:hypothetical protein
VVVSTCGAKKNDCEGELSDTAHPCARESSYGGERGRTRVNVRGIGGDRSRASDQVNVNGGHTDACHL